MIDTSKIAAKQGSAAFIQTRVTTADPNNFKSAIKPSQAYDSYLKQSKNESAYLNSLGKQ